MRLLSSRWLRAALGVAGLAFIAINLVRRGIPADSLGDLGVGRILGVTALVTVALLCASAGWAFLTGRRFSVSGLAYLRYLPAKHIPGGLGLPIAQVSYEASRGEGPGQAVARLVQHLFVSLGVGGVIVVSLGLFSGDASSRMIAVGLALAFGLVLALPRVISRFLKLSRFEGLPAPVPAVVRACLSTAIGILALGVAFAALLGDSATPVTTRVAGFVLAWSIGLAAVPVPGGIGVREGALIAALPSIGSAEVLMASLLLRVISIGCELLLALLARLASNEDGVSAGRLAPSNVPDD